MRDFHFPHLNLFTLSSIQRQAYILDVHVRCTTSETFYSVKISVARATQLRRLIVGIAGLLQCTHHLSFAPNCLTEGDMGVYGIAVLGFFSCGISVILILTCGIAVSSSSAVGGFHHFG